MLSFTLVFCLGAVFSLAPLAIYLLWLATLNRRLHPTVLAGGWDFAALLGGLAGFILFGGGLFLSLLQSNARILFRGNVEAMRDAWGQENVTWVVTVAVYLLIVVGSVLLTLASRRRTLVVYNVDPGQFEAAILNMVMNARDAMMEKGEMVIRVESMDLIPASDGYPLIKGRFVAVSITDNGSGIAPFSLDRIFEPFFSTKGKGQRTGLGLSQVLGFAKQSGGEIRVESRLGQGSTFTLYLPRP